MSELDEEMEFRDSELMIEQALLRFKKSVPKPTGFCLWCKEATGNNTTFYCCKECGEDAERYNKANRRM